MNYILSYETIGAKPYYCCTLEKEDENTVCCDMLLHADMPGILRPSAFEENGRLKLMYPLEGCVPLRCAVHKEKEVQYPGVILGLCDAAISCEEYMLDDGTVSVSISSVLWNREKYKSQFIIVPGRTPGFGLNERFSELLRAVTELFESKGQKTAAEEKLRGEICAVLHKKGGPDYRELRRAADAIPAPGQEASLFQIKERCIFRISGENIFIGRDREKCAVCFEDNPEISRIHAGLTKNPGGVFTVRDAGSSNGTYLNGEKLLAGRDYKLKNNDILSFAGAECRFYC